MVKFYSHNANMNIVIKHANNKYKILFAERVNLFLNIVNEANTSVICDHQEVA